MAGVMKVLFRPKGFWSFGVWRKEFLLHQIPISNHKLKGKCLVFKNGFNPPSSENRSACQTIKREFPTLLW